MLTSNILRIFCCFQQIHAVKMRSVESVPNVKYKITGLNAVAPAITLAIHLLSVKENQCYVTDSVLAMTADTVCHCVKPTLIAHVERNVSMELVELYAPYRISALKDNYV